MNRRNQFVNSIFEPRSLLPLHSITFCLISNLFVNLSAARGTICDILTDFDIAISNSLAELVLKTTKSSWGGLIANRVGFRKGFRKEIFRQFRVAKYLSKTLVLVSIIAADQKFLDCSL